jgi:hypothetical protein
MVKLKVIDPSTKVAMKMNKLRMYDIAASIRAAGKDILNNMELSAGGDYYIYRGELAAIEWLKEACEEWENYVTQVKKELNAC